MFLYPSTVSRTLDPSGKSLLTVVGLHDRELSDADINLIQDLQGLKRQQLLKDGPANSGCLTYSPLAFDTTVANTFTVPRFDVLFNGEVVTVTGSLSADQTVNKVILPPPAFWYQSQDEPARIYVAFLELWYQSLDPTLGSQTGYYVDPTTNQNYFYPYGGVTPDPSLLESIPDDSVDIFNNGLFTTQRAQIQWRINVQRVTLAYDFTINRYGIDPLGPGVNQGVYAQAGQSTPINTDTAYQFHNLGAITGDTGLWRAGDGNPNNFLGTMDGYSYAMPLAVVFQRNSGPFYLSNNVFGCADPHISASGLIQYEISGRFDSRLADQIYADDTVDLRQTVSLDGWDFEKLANEGIVDLFTGNLRSHIGRGISPGMSPSALGSALDYYVSVAPALVANTQHLGAFDGFSNGFSSDLRTFPVTQRITINNKSVGTKGSRWTQNDAFVVALPSASSASISSVFLQGFNSPSPGIKIPINLLSGQVRISGIGSKTIVVSFPFNLIGTSFDPGANNLYVTLGVSYPAGGKANLVNIPIAMDGGTLFDADSASGKTLPVYGVSEYVIQTQQLSAQAYQVWTYNPEYSSVQFGTRVWVQIPGSSGVQQTVASGVVTTFTIPRMGINGNVNGLYSVSAFDLTTGNVYAISSRGMTGTSCVISIQQAVPANSIVVVVFMAQDTAQAAFNAPVKGVTEIEETVLFGTYPSSSSFTMDSRVVVESVSYDNVADVSTVVLASNNCIIKGISGDDTNKFVWVVDQSNNLTAVQCSAVDFNNGFVTITVPGVNLVTGSSGTNFFFVGSILPAFNPNSVLVLEERYIPYQGEGVTARNYEILFTDDNALITTNGTGTAPIVGLADVFPYNRQLPISTTLPSQVGWLDSTLTNLPLSTLFDSNYVAMRQSNVETVFEVPLHTNDFILPLNRDIRKQIQLLQGGTGGRGFSQAIPHVGFAITAPAPKTALGQNLQSTIAPIVFYVNNASGNDSNDGLSLSTPKLTITAAVAVLPPVLRHPCSIQLVSTGVAYSISSLSSTLQVIALGDGTVRSSKWYALANLAFSIQEEGRVVITSTAAAISPVVIDATGWQGFGDGPTSAFFVDNSRVIFNNLQFQGFVNPAVYGIDSDVEFVSCVFQNNAQAAGFEQGSGVIMTGGSITLPAAGTGVVLSQSELTVSDVDLAVAAAATPGSFFVAERSSSLNLSIHAPAAGQETNISASTVVAYAQLNSSIAAAGSFQTAGQAILTANSVLSRSVTIDPFLGGITLDPSSSVVTQL